jgi:hypothetical protein
MRKFLRFVVLVGALGLGLVGLVATAAGAADGSAPVAAVFTLSAAAVTIITGQALPILVGIVTKASLSSAWKAVLHGLLSVVAGAVVVATQLDGTAVFSKVTLVDALVVWISGMATYAGFLSKTISPKVNAATADFGVG